MVFSKHSADLFFQRAVALTQFVNTLAIDRKLLSCSMDAGFVLALPLHHGDLELDSVRVSTKSYNVKISCYLVAWPWLGGLFMR